MTVYQVTTYGVRLNTADRSKNQTRSSSPQGKPSEPYAQKVGRNIPTQVWTYDFLEDATADGRKLTSKRAVWRSLTWSPSLANHITLLICKVNLVLAWS